MKKIGSILFLVLSLNGCCSINMGAGGDSPGCTASLVATAVILSPILVPYAIVTNLGENEEEAIQRKRYENYKTGIEAGDYQVIKEFVEYSRFYEEESYFKPKLREEASEKLIKFKPDCLQTKDYTIYLTAYFYLIEGQNKNNEKVDPVLLKETWSFYQNLDKIAYNQGQSECSTIVDETISYSIQQNVQYSQSLSFADKISNLKAQLFNLTLENKSKQDIDVAFEQCPRFMFADNYDKPSTLINNCSIAFRLYNNLKAKSSNKTLNKLTQEWKLQLKLD